MSQNRSPASTKIPGNEALRPPVLRKLLRKLLLTDPDLNAFCLDYFPETHRRFSDGMDRTSKINLLLQLTGPAEVVSRLREQFRGNQDALDHIAHHLAERESAEAQRAWALSQDLEMLYILRERQRLSGQDTSALDGQIVSVKQALRQVPQLQEGEILGDRYKLLEVIGKGGFGRVWQAYDRAEPRLVALKVLHAEQNEDLRHVERFVRGAHQMRALDHANIVRVLDGPAKHSSFHYFVMDYLSGGDLHKAVTSGALDRAQALRAVLDVGIALQYAHERRLIHRDIKPQNILLDGRGGTRLTDFDLVWAPDTTGGTRTGFLGTHVYAAPEQAEDAKSVDARADIYSLGMTTLFVLYRKALPQKAVYQRALFIDELECDEPAKALLRRATAIDPDDRPASIEEFCSALRYSFPDNLPLSSEKSPAITSRTIRDPGTAQVFPLGETVPPQLTRDHRTSSTKLSAEVKSDIKQQSRRLPAIRTLFGLTVLATVSGGFYWWLDRPPMVDPEAEAKKLLTDIDNHIAGKRWSDAVSTATRLITNPAISPKTRDGANTRRTRAEQEVRVQSIYDRFLNSGDNYDRALQLYKDIPTESVYHQSAREMYDMVFPLFVEKHIKAAESARVLGHCDEFRKEIKLILAVDPEQIKAQQAQDRPCGEKSTLSSGDRGTAVAKNDRESTTGHSQPRPESKSGGSKTPDPQTPAKPLEVNSAEADQTLTNARTEFVNGNFSQAISLAQSVQRFNPTRAWRIIGAAACNIKDGRLASEAYKHLDAAGRQYLVFACSRQGIANTGSHFELYEPDQTLAIAQTKFENGDFLVAIYLAQSVQHVNPTRAWRIIGAAECSIKNVRLASEALEHLDAAGRMYLVDHCSRQGIAKTTDSQFELNERSQAQRAAVPQLHELR